MVDQGTRTLWVGDLEKWMDESHLFSYFQHTGHCTQVKVLRDKNSNQSIGSGFAEFTSHAMAKHVIDTHNGQPIGYFPGNFSYGYSSLMAELETGVVYASPKETRESGSRVMSEL